MSDELAGLCLGGFGVVASLLLLVAVQLHGRQPPPDDDDGLEGFRTFRDTGEAGDGRGPD